MQCEVVQAAHVYTVHHEPHRDSRALTRIENHRTDGRLRRSTSLPHFDIGTLREKEWLIADVGQLEAHELILAQRHIPQIDHLPMGFQAGRTDHFRPRRRPGPRRRSRGSVDSETAPVAYV